MELVELRAGSRAWGINDAGSDYDLIQVFLPRPAQLFGFEDIVHSSQTVAENACRLDVRRYSLTHFADEVMKGNANFVMMLWLPCNYDTSQWLDLKLHATDLFDAQAFAKSAIKIAEGQLVKGTLHQDGKHLANGMAMLMFAEDLLRGLPEIPLTDNKTAILQSIRESKYVSIELVQSCYRAVEEQAQRWPAFDKAEAVRRFMQTIWSAWL